MRSSSSSRTCVTTPPLRPCQRTRNRPLEDGADAPYVGPLTRASGARHPAPSSRIVTPIATTDPWSHHSKNQMVPSGWKAARMSPTIGWRGGRRDTHSNKDRTAGAHWLPRSTCRPVHPPRGSSTKVLSALTCTLVYCVSLAHAQQADVNGERLRLRSPLLDASGPDETATAAEPTAAQSPKASSDAPWTESEREPLPPSLPAMQAPLVVQMPDSERAEHVGPPPCDIWAAGSRMDGCSTPRNGVLSGMYLGLDFGSATMEERAEVPAGAHATTVLQLRVGFEFGDFLVLGISFGHYFVSDRRRTTASGLPEPRSPSVVSQDIPPLLCHALS